MDKFKERLVILTKRNRNLEFMMRNAVMKAKSGTRTQFICKKQEAADTLCNFLEDLCENIPGNRRIEYGFEFQGGGCVIIETIKGVNHGTRKLETGK